MSYSDAVLVGLRDGLLISLCDKCHRLIEIDDHGVKRDLFNSNMVLLQLVNSSGSHVWVKQTKSLLNIDLDEIESMRRCEQCGKEFNKNIRHFCKPHRKKNHKKLAKLEREAFKVKNS